LPPGDTLIFIHGFHNTFAEAICRSAQMAADLNFRGASICYSWPSKGTLGGYVADGNVIALDRTVRHFLQLLRDLVSKTEIGVINLIAHSMGNRLLLECLQKVALDFSKSDRERFGQVILAAPDIDAMEFGDVAARMVPAAKHMTTYVSSNDVALKLSRQAHDFPRIGDKSGGIVIVDGIDTIDASDVPSDFLGHSYFVTGRPVLGDICTLVDTGKLPPRFGLKEAEIESKRYWFFQK
jgi:esterase/lipase superfamily enzyme